MSVTSAPTTTISSGAKAASKTTASPASAGSGSSVAAAAAHGIAAPAAAAPAAAAPAKKGHLQQIADSDKSLAVSGLKSMGGLAKGSESSVERSFGAGAKAPVSKTSTSESSLLGAKAADPSAKLSAGPASLSAKAKPASPATGGAGAKPAPSTAQQVKGALKEAGVSDTVWKADASATGKRYGGGDKAQSFVDIAKAQAGAKAGYSANKDGVKGEVSGSAAARLVEAQAKGKTKGAVGQLGGEANAKLLGAEASGSVGAGVDWSKGEASAKAKGEVGAYLAKASGKAEGGFRIPFTNILVGGGVEAGGQIGAGAGGEASASMGAEGFKASLKGSAALGIGGNLGFNFGVSKAEGDKGWFDGAGWW
jgi:hypothetical protein